MSTSPAAARPTIFAAHRGKILAIGILVVPVAIIAAWTLVTLNFSYSEGDRIGYIQKFSRKGWVCRTWEGELAMSPVPGATPEIFPFTVPDDAVAKRLAVVEGKKVAVHYKEKRGVPSACFGDTHYFVTDVRTLGP